MSEAGTFELIWQQDATALAFVRAPDGTLSRGELRVGAPTDARVLGQEVEARRIDHRELLRLAERPPHGYDVGGSARVAFAVAALAERSVTEGLVHPYLDEDDGTWNAFWGATLDASVTAQLTQLAAALPPAGADAFDGDKEETVHDLYPVLATGSRATGSARRASASTPPPAGAPPPSTASSRASRRTRRRCRRTPAIPRSNAVSRAGCTRG
jgi:hypothetical protein